MASPIPRPGYSLSSQMTTKVCSFRNSQGGEKTWTNTWEKAEENPLYLAGRIIALELTTPLLVLAALIETAVYSALLLPALFSWPLSSFYLQRTIGLWQSSFFTIYWNVSNALFLNPCLRRIPADESLARFYVDHYEPSYFKKGWVREKDALLLYDLYKEAFQKKFEQKISSFPIAPAESEVFTDVLRLGKDKEDEINKGVLFFKEKVLGGDMEESTRELIRSRNPQVALFVASRALYLYVYGENRQSSVFSFFKKKTQAVIPYLRTSQDISVPAAAMRDHILFKDVVKKHPLKDAADRELKESLFMTRCWELALKRT